MTLNSKENTKLLVNISQMSDILKQIIANELRPGIFLLIKNKRPGPELEKEDMLDEIRG